MELLKLLEGVRSPFLDSLFSAITRLGEETVVVIVLCVILWCIDKRIAYSIGIVYVLSALAVQCMKVCFQIERPWVIEPTLKPVRSALETATGYSFPSGHTQSAAALFGTLGTQVKRAYTKAMSFLLVILVAFSRLYLGVHTINDITVSLLLTLIFIFVAVKTNAGSVTDKTRLKLLASLMLLYTISIAVIAILLSSYGKIESDDLSDCIKAVGAGAGFIVGMYIERRYIEYDEQMKSVLKQAIKLIIGIAGVLIIKEAPNLLINIGLVSDTVRYFLMLFWVTALSPLVFKKMFHVKQ